MTRNVREQPPKTPFTNTFDVGDDWSRPPIFDTNLRSDTNSSKMCAHGWTKRSAQPRRTTHQFLLLRGISMSCCTCPSFWRHRVAELWERSGRNAVFTPLSDQSPQRVKAEGCLDVSHRRCFRRTRWEET